MQIRYTIHQSVRDQCADRKAVVRGIQARRTIKYLRKYERPTGGLTGFYPDLGITVHQIAP